MALNGLSQYDDQVRARELKAVELRNARLTFREIGREIGCTEEAARQMVKRALQRDISSEVEQLRREHLSTLEAIVRGSYAKAVRGDPKASETVMKALREMRKYVGGLEVPTEIKADVRLTETTIDDLWAQYQLGRMDEAEEETPVE